MALADLIASGDTVTSAFSKESPIGSTITGTVISTDVRQTRNYETGDPETWADGNPRQQAVITLETTQRSSVDDDGHRAVYVKWWGEQRKALVAAVRAAGDVDVRVGGTFTATYYADGEQENKKLNPPKLYRYTYVPPSATAGLIAEAAPVEAPAPVPQAAPPAAPATPPAAPIPAPAANGMSKVDQAKALIAAGLTDVDIAAAVGLGDAAVAAIRNLP